MAQQSSVSGSTCPKAEQDLAEFCISVSRGRQRFLGSQERTPQADLAALNGGNRATTLKQRECRQTDPRTIVPSQ